MLREQQNLLLSSLVLGGLALSWFLRKRKRSLNLAAGSSVGIIGGGVGGIATAKRCLDEGIPFHIYEMAHDFGGTWLYNNYPGCGCDVPSHAYSFSWGLNPEWTRKWTKRDEILAYFHYIAKNVLNLEPHTSFLTKVNKASFKDGVWTLEVENVQTGKVSTHTHQFLMSSVGQLNIPFVPDYLDATKFQGERIFHSARWPENLDLKGKRVACIGTGASAIQFVPAIAPQCSKLHVFQRSRNFVFEKPDYEYPALVKSMFRYLPFTMKIYRAYIFIVVDVFVYYWVIANSSVQPSFWNKLIATTSLDFIKQEAPPHLVQDMIPQEMLGCKRLLISSEWCKTFKLPQVQLETEDPVVEITAHGVRCKSGKSVDVDVVVFATGFETGSFLKGLTIQSWKDNRWVDLHQDVWKDTVSEAYRGVTVMDMPNFGMCYAANTNLNHSSIISVIECEVEHFIELVTTTLASRKQTFCVKTDAYRRFNVKEQELLKTTAFNADCDSWYKRNKAMKIVNNYHGSLYSFWKSTQRVIFKDYDLQ